MVTSVYYISRRIGATKYGVVDTDDGAEDIMTLKEIREAVLKHGYEIKGVDVIIGLSEYSHIKDIGRIYVWQDVSEQSVRQVKLKSLNGVEIKTQGDMIVSIVLPKDAAQRKACSVRLSDYGSVCADYLFNDTKTQPKWAGNFLTLILDDKLEVTSKSFNGAGTLEIHFDLREVTNKRTVESAYKSVLSDSLVSVTSLWNYYIDDVPERIDYWKAVCVLQKGFQDHENFKHVREVLDYPDETLPKINKKYVREFISVSDSNLLMTQSGKPAMRALHTYIGFLFKSENKGLVTCHDFQTLLLRCAPDLFKVLAACTACNSQVLIRYLHYLLYFDVPSEVKSAFINFCDRANEFCVDYVVKEGFLSRDTAERLFE